MAATSWAPVQQISNSGRQRIITAQARDNLLNGWMNQHVVPVARVPMTSWLLAQRGLSFPQPPVLVNRPASGQGWPMATFVTQKIGNTQTTVLTNVNGVGVIPFAPGFVLLSAQYSAAGRLRLYRTAAGRASDSGRAFTTPYAGGAGLIYDYLAAGAEVDGELPVRGARAPGESQTYYTASGPMTVTLTWVQTAEEA